MRIERRKGVALYRQKENSLENHISEHAPPTLREVLEGHWAAHELHTGPFGQRIASKCLRAVSSLIKRGSVRIALVMAKSRKVIQGKRQGKRQPKCCEDALTVHRWQADQLWLRSSASGEEWLLFRLKKNGNTQTVQCLESDKLAQLLAAGDVSLQFSF